MAGVALGGLGRVKAVRAVAAGCFDARDRAEADGKQDCPGDECRPARADRDPRRHAVRPLFGAGRRLVCRHGRHRGDDGMRWRGVARWIRDCSWRRRKGRFQLADPLIERRVDVMATGHIRLERQERGCAVARLFLGIRDVDEETVRGAVEAVAVLPELDGLRVVAAVVELDRGFVRGLGGLDVLGSDLLGARRVVFGHVLRLGDARQQAETGEQAHDEMGFEGARCVHVVLSRTNVRQRVFGLYYRIGEKSIRPIMVYAILPA